MSNLSTKILSYSPEQYIPFNTPYSLSPTNLGSGGTGAWSLNNEAPILNATGGPDSTGCWQYNIGGNSDTSATRFRILSSTSVTVNPEITDGSFSTGIWFRYTAPLTTTQTLSSSMTIFNVAYKSLYTTISVTGATSSNSNRGKLQTSSTQTGALVYSPTRIDDGSWHYLAIRFNETSSGVFNSEVYVDGTLWTTITAKTFTPSTTYLLETGFITQMSVTDNIGMLELSNLYITPYSTISSTEISEIYAAGAAPTSTNVTITETPATASALQTEPTIAITANDHVEVTTSILVSAEFPQNIVAIGDKNVEIHPDIVPTALVEMINNVEVSSGLDISFSAIEMTASADIMPGVVSRPALTASAQSGDHTVFVTPNYYNLVKQISPVFYNELDDPTITNKGSWTLDSYTKGSTIATELASTGDLGLVGAGQSWKATGNYNNAPDYLYVYPADADNAIYNLEQTRNFTLEYWFKPINVYSAGIGVKFGSFQVGYDRAAKTMYMNASQTLPAWNYPLTTVIPGDIYERYFVGPSNAIIVGDWNYIALKVTPGSGNNANVALYINNILAGSLNIQLNTYDPVNINRFSFFSSEVDSYIFDYSYPNHTVTPNGGYAIEKSLKEGNTYFDELAIYPRALTNSEIIDHYSFIYNQSPDRNVNHVAYAVSATSGNHNFIVQSNAIISTAPGTSTALAVQPVVVASRNLAVSSEAMTASATGTSAIAYWGRTMVAQPMTSYAESINAFRLNDIYYNYVQANVAPYRYVTFDGNNPYLDYGTDNDYSVAAVTVGGSIVNPDLGINGKSVLTTGTSHVTDGVILKESEWNDNWGTGLNNYHSSFWIQKSENDNSTGLRVIWNLNGHYDNQHAILYQYQGKLHLNFNNGSGTSINQATVSNYDLFDGQRHFVAVAFDHTGSNNRVNLFVDAVDVMTVDLGSYTGTTINGIVSVPANDEANNHPRLSVGCLITPFASTSLPVQPANTKVIVDEVYWAKTAATQTLITNLFNVMPSKNDKNNNIETFTATALMTTATITTTSNVLASSFNSDSELVQPEQVAADRNIILVANIATASADIINALRIEHVAIVSDIFIATATFNDHGLVISIPGGPMVASVAMLTGITPLTPYTDYIRYLSSKKVYKQQKLREVK